MDLICLAVALHAGGGVDGVTEEAVAGHREADDTGDDGARVHPTRICTVSEGMWGMRKVSRLAMNPSDMSAISFTCRSPLRCGSPDTQRYPSPMVSTLYTSWASMIWSKFV
ncbi:hypothetical protein L596_023606 [Steinernema carpocapsae]|uniref:Uncharacterized protein n=1 Tax=Steinernema carpocapsae TaxID=34508 RepID=A0A4U5ME50_STECR|nr:hypothetical protein L596_023606 [Steinernema carpocapsae]